MEKQRTYKWVRGLLQASAFTSVMFIMQACYGTPNNNYMKETKLTIAGTITDKASSQPIEGIYVTINESDFTATSDENGEFKIDYVTYDDPEKFDMRFSDNSGRYQMLDTIVAVKSALNLNINLRAVE